jgi:ADYC domain
VSNRAWIGAGVIAMLIGCRTTGHPGPPGAETRSPLGEGAATGSPPPGDGGVSATVPPDTDTVQCPAPCPDPPTCTCTNGTGVYAAEGGFAGITVRMGRDGRTVSLPIMITHFINNGSGLRGNVTFNYGYFDPSTNQWKSPGIGTGRVDSADYGSQTDFRVISVHEGIEPTMPLWELLDPATGTPVRVSDSQMPALGLYISFTVPGGTPGSMVLKKALLSFNKVPKIARNGGGYVYVYGMQWKNLSDSSIASPQQYCRDSSQKPDTVVFQQGINVDPATGKVAPRSGTANLVTLSCFQGAPAKVYSWGYSYQGSSSSSTFYFDAGIHMKRASYCADFRHYTWAGTSIDRLDDQEINKQIPPPPPNSPLPPDLEAWWSPDGALCVNSEHMRHSSLAPKDIDLLSCNGNPYNGQPQQLQNCFFVCKVNGQSISLPKCPLNPLQQPWPQFLVERPTPPVQP